ncbi:hypothetical protein Hanom_Chr05g00413381 [Helianthus anomalus]
MLEFYNEKITLLADLCTLLYHTNSEVLEYFSNVALRISHHFRHSTVTGSRQLSKQKISNFQIYGFRLTWIGSVHNYHRKPNVMITVGLIGRSNR